MSVVIIPFHTANMQTTLRFKPVRDVSDEQYNDPLDSELCPSYEECEFDLLPKYSELPAYTLIRSDKGTGKTELADQQIATILQANPEANILILSPKIAYANAIHKRFERHNFTNYKACSEIAITASRIIISLESLHRLQNKKTVYDLILLDETESLVRTFYSSTMDGRRRLVERELEAYMRVAKQILGLDADAARRSYAFLTNFSGRHFHVLNNIKITDMRRYVRHLDEGSFLFRIEDAIKREANMVICTASAKWGQALHDWLREVFPAIDMQFVHGGLTEVEKRHAMGDGITQWWAHQVLIITPVAPVGVDFSWEYFDLSFIYGCQGSCTAQELFQLSWRVRKLSMNEVHLFVPGKQIVDGTTQHGPVPPSSKYPTIELYETKYNVIYDLIRKHEARLLHGGIREEMLVSVEDVPEHRRVDDSLWVVTTQKYAVSFIHNTQEDHWMQNDFGAQMNLVIAGHVYTNQIVSYFMFLQDNANATRPSEKEMKAYSNLLQQRMQNTNEKNHDLIAKVDACSASEAMDVERAIARNEKVDVMILAKAKKRRLEELLDPVSDLLSKPENVKKFSKPDLQQRIKRFKAAREGETKMIRQEETFHTSGNQLAHTSGEIGKFNLLIECLERFFNMSVWRTVDGLRERFLPFPAALVTHDILEQRRIQHKPFLLNEWNNIQNRFPRKRLPFHVPACVDDLLLVLRAMTLHFGFKIRKKSNDAHGLHYLLDSGDLKKTCKTI